MNPNGPADTEQGCSQEQLQKKSCPGLYSGLPL
jgi:hypothetical protein